LLDFMTMTTKSAPLGTLGLPDGDHVVRFHIEHDTVSFEVAEASPDNVRLRSVKKPTGFVEKWGGTARKVEDTNDPWLSHINAKHLR
jgi:hypothetical protein